MENATDSLESIFGKEEKDTQAQPLGETQEQKTIDEQLQKKQEQLSNLNKAIQEANNALRDKRKAPKRQVQEEEEEIPKIDMNDPGSKAWDRHISEKVTPLQTELDKEKQEIRSFALRRFLEDKPNLVQSQEKIKVLMDTYDRIKTASERTVEGVLMDLDRAYAAENHEELLAAAGQRVSSRAKAEEAFSDIAVSRGSTAYPTQRTSKRRRLSDEERELVIKAYGSEAEYWKYQEKYGDK